MKDEHPEQKQGPYYNHDSEVWTPYVRVFGAGFAGVLLILWGCSKIPAEDQFWNVFILGSVTWLILVTAWVQIGVTQKQWQAMQDGLGLQRELFELAERPSLGIVAVSFTIIADGHGVIGLSVTNSGRSPALSVNVEVNVQLSPVNKASALCPEPDKKTTEGGIASRSVIPVNASQLAFCNTPISLGIQDPRQLPSGDVWVMVWARSTYRGFGGGEYFVEYYARYNPAHSSFDVCDKHNNAN
jgi:hypothetical protein